MADPRYGVAFSQEGIPLKRAADYQKVLDDRWPFLDIAFEQEVPVAYEVKASTANYRWSVEILAHNLGILPGFTYRILTGSLVVNFNDNTEIVATKQGIYMHGLYLTGDPTATIVVKLLIRIFPIDMLKPVVYPIEAITARTRTNARKYGVKFLKDGVNPERFKGDEMSDFSINNNAKALAVQQVGQLDLNPWARYDNVKATAIDTTSNIITVGLASSADDLSWTWRVGQAVSYTPSDFVTMPNPLSIGTVYYIIPVDSNRIKLANSYNNALLGSAIDLTTAGSLPGTISPQENSSDPKNVFTHNVGYPPTYMLAEYELWADRSADTNPYMRNQDIIHALNEGFVQGYTRATTTTLSFTGAQAVASGKYAVLILKDPIEVAG